MQGLTLSFAEGLLAGLDAISGKEAFCQFLTSDKSGVTLRLGEIALLSMDSPICRGNTVYHEILIDEKRRSHLALGEGYSNTIQGGPTMSTEQLIAAGVNRSPIHHDLMIGNETLSLHATTRLGGVVQLLENGVWVKDLLQIGSQ